VLRWQHFGVLLQQPSWPNVLVQDGFQMLTKMLMLIMTYYFEEHAPQGIPTAHHFQVIGNNLGSYRTRLDFMSLQKQVKTTK
jgi:hypothetical protein